METILIQIASYRDWELANTIESALNKAHHPGRLRFAIVMQDEPEKFTQLDRYQGDSRFKIEFQHWRDSRGVGVARHLSDKMYSGEDFYFQIDAHTRFIEGWDEALISEWKAIGDKRGVISSYPPAYKYNEEGVEEYVASNPNRLVVHDMFMETIPVFFGQAITDPSIGQRGAFVAGGMQFGPGEVCMQVSYESLISFIGEEIVHSLRLFNAGYNVYSAINQVIYHLYLRSQNQEESHHFWMDFLADEELKPIYTDMNNLSYQTVQSYLEGKFDVSPEMIARFENFAGVDFKSRKVHQDTYLVPPLPIATDGIWRTNAIEPKKQN